MWHRWALVAVVAISFARPQIALACSCVQSTKPQVVESATVIFTGTVTAERRSIVPFMTCNVSSADPVTFDFAVDQVFKGDVPRTVAVSTVVSGASCGYEFQVGKRYTVFATGAADRLETGLCRGNVAGSIVESEYGLGPGKAPTR